MASAEISMTGNFCYKEAKELHQAKEEFGKYGFYCGSGACYPGATEECDSAYKERTCQACDSEGNCWSYDCSYCEGPVGPCEACRQAEKRYNDALDIWNKCIERQKAFLDQVQRFAGEAIYLVQQNLLGGRM